MGCETMDIKVSDNGVTLTGDSGVATADEIQQAIDNVQIAKDFKSQLTINEAMDYRIALGFELTPRNGDKPVYRLIPLISEDHILPTIAAQSKRYFTQGTITGAWLLDVFETFKGSDKAIREVK